LCVSAGEALPAHLGEEWEREFGVQLLDGIGSTEMLHMFMSNHENDVRYGSSGRCSRVTKLGCLTKTANRRRRRRRKSVDQRRQRRAFLLGESRSDAHRLLSMAGFALAISIAATAMVTGFTWAAATIVSNRAGSGFRRLRLKACCCDIRVSRVRRWLKILTPITSLRVCVCCEAGCRIRLGNFEQELRKLVAVNRCRDSNNRAGTFLFLSCLTRRREDSRFSGSNCRQVRGQLRDNGQR
jgi:hypothetical protein